MTILISFFFISAKKKIGFISFHFAFPIPILFPTFKLLFIAFPPRFPEFPPLFTPFPPRFPAFWPHFSQSPHFPHSHPDSPHSHSFSLHFHPHSLHSPYSVPWFLITAFADSPIPLHIFWKTYRKPYHLYWFQELKADLPDFLWRFIRTFLLFLYCKFLGSNLRKFIFMIVTTILWESNHPVLITVVFWKYLGNLLI